MNRDIVLKVYLLIVIMMGIIEAKNLGHRLGGDIYKPENTLYSYKKAITNLYKKEEFKNIEFDIRESKDGEIIVFHDSKIERIVPSSKHNLNVLKRVLKKKKFNDIRIKDLTAKEISKLLLKYNSTIPTLKDILDASEKWKIRKPIYIEIKSLHTDNTRYKLIDIASFYNKKLDISLVAFRKSFLTSFPFTERWIQLLQRKDLKVYQIDKYEFTEKLLPINNFTTLLPETKFTINKKEARTQKFLFFLPQKTKNNGIIKIGIYGGDDNSGDRGLNFRIINKKGKLLASGFSNAKLWEWFSLDVLLEKELFLVLEDYDTDLEGKYPGNGGMVKILFMQ